MKMIAVWAVLYLLFCASGFWAVVKFFRMPNWDNYSKKFGDGLDLSWCELVAFGVVSLIPIANVSMNAFWFWVLRQQIKRRPLINWPKTRLPKFKLPKCPVALRGIKVKNT